MPGVQSLSLRSEFTLQYVLWDNEVGSLRSPFLLEVGLMFTFVSRRHWKDTAIAEIFSSWLLLLFCMSLPFSCIQLHGGTWVGHTLTVSPEHRVPWALCCPGLVTTLAQSSQHRHHPPQAFLLTVVPQSLRTPSSLHIPAPCRAVSCGPPNSDRAAPALPPSGDLTPFAHLSCCLMIMDQLRS